MICSLKFLPSSTMTTSTMTTLPQYRACTPAVLPKEIARLDTLFATTEKQLRKEQQEADRREEESKGSRTGN